jgi:hypothetical protein
VVSSINAVQVRWDCVNVWGSEINIQCKEGLAQQGKRDHDFVRQDGSRFLVDPGSWVCHAFRFSCEANALVENYECVHHCDKSNV